jgi:hypothetical protein
MKAGEVKMRLSNVIIEMIDTYFGGMAMNEKFINSTLKIILKQNLYKVDSILGLFADKNGDINIQDIVDEYLKMIGDDGIVFDLKQYIDNDFAKSLIPDKILVIKKEDISKLLV